MTTLAKTKKTSLDVQVKQRIPIERISDLLCSAFEGGSNYWYQIDEFVKPENFNNSDEGDDKYRHLSYPINEGGKLIISTDEGEMNKEGNDKHILNLESIKKGLQVMATKYPSHFNDFMQENDDACTGDVFLQCCLFGEVIFG
jgi:hypothetical protein